MNARIRRRVEMGRRALLFSRAHADASAGYAATLARLEGLLARSDALSEQQLNGLHIARAASERKRELRRMMKTGHLRHLIEVARHAAGEEPELAARFVLPELDASYLAFSTMARTLAAEASANREVLVRHGLVESVLDDLVGALGRFEQALALAAEGRRAHVGASAELERVAVEVVAVVKVLNGLNRIRFATDAEQLAAWRSASKILRTARGAGEVKPAA